MKNFKINVLIKWIKRISWQTWLAITLSALGTYFGYDSYTRSNSGEIKTVINGLPCKESLTIVLLHTEDTIQVHNPQLSQNIKNISRYSIKNFKVNCRISISPYDKFLNESFKFEVNPSFQKTSMYVHNGKQCIDFVYKQSELYAGEFTPPFLTKITLTPKNSNDSIIHSFDIITTVNWDGADEKTFYTKVNFALVPSTHDFESWVESVIKFSKGKFPNCDTDVILCYKTYSDSINEYGVPKYNKGCYTHFKNLNNTLIDSISFKGDKSPSLDFLTKHLNNINIDTPSPEISYFKILIVIILFLISLLMLILFIKEFKRNSKGQKVTLFLFAALTLGCSIYYFSDELYKIYDSTSLMNFLKITSCAIISLTSILYVIYFLIIGVKNIKIITQLYLKEKSTIIAWTVAIIIFSGAAYFFMNEFIDLIRVF